MAEEPIEEVVVERDYALRTSRSSDVEKVRQLLTFEGLVPTVRGFM